MSLRSSCAWLRLLDFDLGIAEISSDLRLLSTISSVGRPSSSRRCLLGSSYGELIIDRSKKDTSQTFLELIQKSASSFTSYEISLP
jgi:hypothetical protein